MFDTTVHDLEQEAKQNRERVDTIVRKVNEHSHALKELQERIRALETALGSAQNVQATDTATNSTARNS